MEDEELGKVKHPESSLVMCDYDTCPEYGEYMKCYFDIYKRCNTYYKYMEKLVHGELEDDAH